jgi:hypothetical protein
VCAANGEGKGPGSRALTPLNSGHHQWQPGDGGVDWRVLMWQGRTHFEHMALDDWPYLPGPRARLSVSSPQA